MRGKFRTWYERKFRGGQKWLTAFLTICVLLFGLILTDSHFTRKDMAAHAERKQEEMRFLIARAEEKFPGSPGIAKPEHQVSELLTMAITYDAVRSAYSRGSEAFVASAIENEIKKKLPHVRLVERKALNLILEELNLALSSLSENRIQPKLLNAKHILLIEIDRSLFQSFILMRLFDTETGTVIFSSVEKLESGRVASQNICENLLKVLLARGKHGMRETYGEDDF